MTHVVHTFDILGMGGAQLDLTTPAAHATANLCGLSVDVLAINGPSHEECRQHADLRFVPPPRRQVLLVTRDPHNAPRLKKDKSFLRADSESTLGADTKVTDATSARIHVAFRDLMDLYIGATTATDLEDSLYAELAS